MSRPASILVRFCPVDADKRNERPGSLGDSSDCQPAEKSTFLTFRTVFSHCRDLNVKGNESSNGMRTWVAANDLDTHSILDTDGFHSERKDFSGCFRLSFFQIYFSRVSVDVA